MSVKAHLPEPPKRHARNIAPAFSLAVLAAGGAGAQPKDACGFQRAGTTHRLAGFPKIHAFEETLVEEAIPEIDGAFRTIADRDHRALIGLSMSGMQTLQIGAAHLDLFAYLGIFTGTPMAQSQAQVDPVAAQGAGFSSKVRLLWFTVGTTEAQLEKAGIASGYDESPGTAHEFQTWRRCLHEFAPLAVSGLVF